MCFGETKIGFSSWRSDDIVTTKDLVFLHLRAGRWRIIYVLMVWHDGDVWVFMCEYMYLLCMSACFRKCENWMGNIILGCLSFPYAQIAVWSYIYRMTFIIYNVSYPDKQHFPHPSHTHYTYDTLNMYTYLPYTQIYFYSSYWCVSLGRQRRFYFSAAKALWCMASRIQKRASRSLYICISNIHM